MTINARSAKEFAKLLIQILPKFLSLAESVALKWKDKYQNQRFTSKDQVSTKRIIRGNDE